MSDDKSVRADAPTPAQRLIELATDRARIFHWGSEDLRHYRTTRLDAWHNNEERGDVPYEFENCPHPDCLLVRADAAASLPQDGLEQLIADFEAAIAEPGGRQRGTCWTCGVDHDNEQRRNRAVIALTLRRLRHLRVKDAAASRAPSQDDLINNLSRFNFPAIGNGQTRERVEAPDGKYVWFDEVLHALAAGARAVPSTPKTGTAMSWRGQFVLRRWPLRH